MKIELKDLVKNQHVEHVFGLKPLTNTLTNTQSLVDKQ
jgi:hypothetical protein